MASRHSDALARRNGEVCSGRRCHLCPRRVPRRGTARACLRVPQRRRQVTRRREPTNRKAPLNPKSSILLNVGEYPSAYRWVNCSKVRAFPVTSCLICVVDTCGVNEDEDMDLIDSQSHSESAATSPPSTSSSS